MNSKLIVFEGVDHSGKTTIIKELASYLEERNHKVYVTKQPGGDYGEHSQFLYDMCKTNKYNLNSLSNMLAFLLDRSENIAQEIIPKLREGYIVLCDRWWYSTFAYQYYGKELYNMLTPEEIININFIASHFIIPNYGILLDRENTNNNLNNPNDIFESESDSFKERVRKGYSRLIELGYLDKIKVDSEINVTLEKVIDAINY